MDILNANGAAGANQFTFTALRNAPEPMAASAGKDSVADKIAELPGQAIHSTSDLDNVRFEQMQKASQLYGDTYAVSDQRFAIFKDSSGEFVTRFTSLKDGTVHYLPERYLKSFYSEAAGADTTLVKASA